MLSAPRINVALAGTPNSGKTSLFNRLTGLNQHVGNYPGVTVDKKIGSYKKGDITVKVLDLPGTHSLYPVSDDERVVMDVLLDTSNKDHPDLVLYVVNTANLERSLLLMTQISDLGIPVICCLNMMDLAENEGTSVSVDTLQEALRIPVMVINGRTGEGIGQLKDTILHAPLAREKRFQKTLVVPEPVLEQIKVATGTKNLYANQLISCQYSQIGFLSENQKETIKVICERSNLSQIRTEVEDKTARIESIHELVIRSVKKGSEEVNSLTKKIDRLLTHKLWGTIILMVLLFIIFQSIFSFAEKPMEWIDQGFAKLNGWVRSVMTPGLFTDLLTDGIITGIGGIVIFVPQILILFGFVSVLEESGYMTRAVYLSDSLMKNVGLNGRSLVALISGVACAVPAIMSTRTIGNWKERLITIFVTPFISCSARLPVFIVLTAFVVPNEYYFGFLNLQGLVIMGLYLLGVIAAILSAWVMNKLLKTSERSMLMLEMPAYQWPQWKNVGITMVEKSKVFVINAGKIILIVSIILWGLSSFGPGDSMDMAEQAVLDQYQGQNISETFIQNEIAASRLEASYAGHIGKFIEPAIRPLGFDWKMGIALVTSFAAREVFVSTMATIYSAGSAEDEQTVIERMKGEVTISGEPVYTPARSLSLLLFYVFAMQCMSTLAVVKRETKSWRIPFYQFVYMTGLAYLASFIGYNLML